MNFLELARDERYSVRKFKAQAVEKEKLEYILEAGRISPTACNYQPQRILVIESEAAHEKLKQCTSWNFGAPVVLMICYDKTTCCRSARQSDLRGAKIANNMRAAPRQPSFFVKKTAPKDNLGDCQKRY